MESSFLIKGGILMEPLFAVTVWFVLVLLAVRDEQPNWSLMYSLLVAMFALCILTVGGLVAWCVGKFLLSPLWWLIQFFSL